MELDALLSGIGLGGSLIVAIGAQNAFVLRQGLRREHVGAVVALCAGIDILLMTAGVAGLAGLVRLSPTVLTLCTVAGAAFLLWYGWGAARRALAPEVLNAETHGAAQSRTRVLGQALAITLANPHVYLDTVLLVGAIGASQAEAQRLWFLLGASLASVLWFTALGFGARLLAPVFARPVAWRVLDVVVALTMWGLAAGLLRDVLAA
ncbi:MAG: LysE/ArgO family amino acid transporter [Betaproteobacteria bacterium]